jgi:acylphosphatase
VAARHAARNIETFALRIAVCTPGIISIWMRAERRRQLGRSRGPKSLPQIALGFRSTDTLVCVVFLVVQLCLPAVLVSSIFNQTTHFNNQTTHLKQKSCTRFRLIAIAAGTDASMLSVNKSVCATSATIPKFVTDAKQAKRFFVSGLVQGVGFRYFTEGEASRLMVSGYVRNLRDGRVEAYAIGTPEQLANFRAALERGPRFSRVSGVTEEPANVDSQYADEFVTTYDELDV